MTTREDLTYISQFNQKFFKSIIGLHRDNYNKNDLLKVKASSQYINSNHKNKTYGRV